MFEKLIGLQIVSVFEDSIKVSNGNEEFELSLELDHGDCCGYAEFDTHFQFWEDKTRNPIITNVVLDSSGGKFELTFFGESKEIYKLDGEVGSGSGWQYGAYVKINCDKLKINEILGEW